MATSMVVDNSIKVPEADNCYFLSLLSPQEAYENYPKGSLRAVLQRLISEPLLAF